jgi:ATP-dependent DNA helicase RecQ
MNSNEIDIHKELKKYFGFSQFKDCRRASDQSLLAGHTFVIMPTGGGKSLATSYPQQEKHSNCCFSSCFNEKPSRCHKKFIFRKWNCACVKFLAHKNRITQVKKDITSA